MKKFKTVVLVTMMLMLTACGTSHEEAKMNVRQEIIEIELSDENITVDGNVVESNATNAVYAANDIVYYEAGKDFTYGEGGEKDAHSVEEAASHTVVHITKPGTYSIEGKLSKGQIAVDLGEDAKDDPEAVVTLVLNGADITCEVAPAVIFYNVFECGSDDAENATKDVDTSAAGANVIIADGTTNNINGSYVEKIYDPESIVLNDDGTEVEDADKLHKYDAAFYSKRTMNVTGEKENTGVLNIIAANEGLDSELHLTINGGIINIQSGNDGINTNEDGVSVTTVNDGILNIKVTGETGEGDGIDSNGWLVINGGTVIAEACSDSADAGIDSDMGIHINGGTVIASGHMLDRIEDGGQNYAVFNFKQKLDEKSNLCFKNNAGEILFERKTENAYSVLIYSSPELSEGSYTLWNDYTQLAGQNSGAMMGGVGMNGENKHGGDMTLPEMPSDGEKIGEMVPPEGMNPPDDLERPEGMNAPDDLERPEGMNPPDDLERPNEMGLDGQMQQEESSVDFEIKDGANLFTVIDTEE